MMSRVLAVFSLSDDAECYLITFQFLIKAVFKANGDTTSRSRGFFFPNNNAKPLSNYNWN